MTKENYIKNRMNYTKNVEDNSLSVLFSGRNLQRTGDQDYDFEVDKNLKTLIDLRYKKIIKAEKGVNGKGATRNHR